MTATFNISPFLRTSRKFPRDPQMLEMELSKSYIEIATHVNSREVCLYYTGSGFINTGQQWGVPVDEETQQALRKVFDIPATAAGASATITHGIPTISAITRLFGTVTTATPDFRPLPYASVTANANIELRATTTDIIINVGAASPNVSSGTVVIEWLP